MLPERDGWSILAALRKAGKQTPVLFLTARDTVYDKVKGLELGADDYLVTLKNVWLNGDYRQGGSVETALWLSLALVTMSYAVARFMKKKGFLKDVPQPVS